MLTVTSARTIEAGKTIKICFIFSLALEQLSLTIFCANPSALIHALGRSLTDYFSVVRWSFNRDLTSLKIKITHLHMNGTEVSIKTKSSLVCFVFLKIKT